MGAIAAQPKTLHDLLVDLANADGDYADAQTRESETLKKLNDIQKGIDAAIDGMKKTAALNSYWGKNR